MQRFQVYELSHSGIALLCSVYEAQNSDKGFNFLTNPKNDSRSHLITHKLCSVYTQNSDKGLNVHD